MEQVRKPAKHTIKLHILGVKNIIINFYPHYEKESIAHSCLMLHCEFYIQPDNTERKSYG